MLRQRSKGIACIFEKNGTKINGSVFSVTNASARFNGTKRELDRVEGKLDSRPNRFLFPSCVNKRNTSSSRESCALSVSDKGFQIPYRKITRVK